MDPWHVACSFERTCPIQYTHRSLLGADQMEAKPILREFVVDTFLFGDTDAKFTDDESLLDSGIVDSTGVLELVGFLEAEFEIDIKDDELVPQNLDSIDNLASFIERKKQQS